MSLQHGEHSRSGAKGELLADRLARFRHGTLEIGDRQVASPEGGGDMSERIFTDTDRLARLAVEQHVTHEANARAGRAVAAAEPAEPAQHQKSRRLHGDRSAHQNSSSRPLREYTN